MDLSQVPDDIKELIVEKTHPNARFTLRKTDKTFQSLVDNSHTSYDTIHIGVPGGGGINLDFETTSNVTKQIEYLLATSSICEVSTEDSDTVTEVHGQTDIERCIADLAILVRSPNCTIRELVFAVDSSNGGVFECLNKELSQFDHKLNLRLLTFNDQITQEQILGVLQHVNLENFVDITARKCNYPLARLAASEHWKKAKSIEIGDVDLPVTSFLHLDWCYIGKMEVSEDDVKNMIQTFLARGETFKSFSYEPVQPNGNLIVERVLEAYENKETRPVIPHYNIKIVGTNYHLNIINAPLRVMFRKVDSTIF